MKIFYSKAGSRNRMVVLPTRSVEYSLRYDLMILLLLHSGHVADTSNSAYWFFGKF